MNQVGPVTVGIKMFRILNKKIKFIKSRNLLKCIYLLFLVIVCLVSFYITFGFGQFGENKPELFVTSKNFDAKFITNGPEHRFWPKSENCSHLVTRFSKTHSLQSR